jgi:myo-inositol-1(or 4)-monophosphatase
MKLDADFFKEAQKVITNAVQAYKPKLMENYGNVGYTAKSDASPVTELDLELEHKLREALAGFDSGIGLQGEELDDEGNENTFWLIDPIDGTENFIRGIPQVRNMITLIDNDEPVYAYVYRVVQDELLIAAKDMGTTLNGETIKVSNRPASNAYIELATNFSDPDVNPLATAIRQRVKGCWMYSDFCYVPMGKLEGQIVYKSEGGAWDYAPRTLLISEAGGKVANLGKDSYDYTDHNYFAANPIVFDELFGLINDVIAKNGYEA